MLATMWFKMYIFLIKWSLFIPQLAKYPYVNVVTRSRYNIPELEEHSESDMPLYI